MWFTLAFVDYIININNFMEACIPLIMVKGHVIIITIQWQLVLNQYRYKSLLDNLQSIVDESMLELLDLCQFRGVERDKFGLLSGNKRTSSSSPSNAFWLEVFVLPDGVLNPWFALIYISFSKLKLLFFREV